MLRRSLWLLIPLTLSPLHFAHAYIDPGAGSYAIQIAIGFIFGTAYAFKGASAKFLAKFKARNKKNKPDA